MRIRRIATEHGILRVTGDSWWGRGRTAVGAGWPPGVSAEGPGDGAEW